MVGTGVFGYARDTHERTKMMEYFSKNIQPTHFVQQSCHLMGFDFNIPETNSILYEINNIHC